MLRLSLALGLLYFSTLPFHPFPGSIAVKGLSTGLLAWMAFQVPGARLAGGALLASAIGDVLLDADPAKLFVPGLIAFLIAHLLYTVVFVRFRPQPFRIPAARTVLSLIAVLYAVWIARWLEPGLGAMRLPVDIYIGVITAMVVTSLCSRLPWQVPTGALLFLVSDSVLAIGRFRSPVPYGAFVVWGTYYAAQFLIATGVLAAFDIRSRQASAISVAP